MRARWNLLLLVALVVLCAGLAQTGRGHALLRDAGLYEEPSSYTELAFTTPGALASALPSSNSPIAVSFGIHNVAGPARAYHWSIVLAKAGQSHVKASGVVTVPAQGRATVARSVAMTCVGGRLQVMVRLASPAESVDFWVTCPARGRSAK